VNPHRLQALRLGVFVIVLLAGRGQAAVAALQVTDGVGRPVALSAPAQRIVSLAPHATELLFAIGAGARVVATVDYSDYPPAARALPRIGGASGIDLERVVALNPDLIVGWASGNPRATIERLTTLGFPVYLTEPHHLADVAQDLEKLGRLAGTSEIAQAEAARFTERSRALTERYAGRTKLRVFYQVLDPLLITVNGEHLISEILRLCGGENVFAALSVLAASVAEEEVIKANPDVIVAGGTEALWREWQTRWRRRTDIVAVKRSALYFIPADRLHRHSPRVLDGAEQLCTDLDDARRRRR
jgi:iron complex transport system substrate-binding protein